jgi:hypothetical protein
MARYAPNLTEWERSFLDSVIDRSRLSDKQEATLRSIVRKAERGEA